MKKPKTYILYESKEDELRAFKETTRKILKSKKTALAFLVKAGILTPTGRLTKAYK